MAARPQRPRDTLARIELASRIAAPALERQDDGPRLGRLFGRLLLENPGHPGPHFRFRRGIVELREQLRRLAEIRQRLLVSRETQERVAEHAQRLHQSIGVAGAPAEFDRGAIRLERGIDAALLQLDVRDRREMERSLDRQQMRAGDLVALDEALERAIEIAHRSIDVRQIVLRVDQLPGILPERRHRERRLELDAGAGIVAEWP